MEGHSLGGACGHSKAQELFLFPHQRKLCTEGLLGRHPLGNAWDRENTARITHDNYCTPAHTYLFISFM